MTWWSWLLTFLAWLVLAWQLWGAATRGEITGRMATYSRRDSPVAFWFSVTIYGALFLILSVLFGATLVRLSLGLPPP